MPARVSTAQSARMNRRTILTNERPRAVNDADDEEENHEPQANVEEQQAHQAFTHRLTAICVCEASKHAD